MNHGDNCSTLSIGTFLVRYVSIFHQPEQKASPAATRKLQKRLKRCNWNMRSKRNTIDEKSPSKLQLLHHEPTA
jgi:hypothetical protein